MKTLKILGLMLICLIGAQFVSAQANTGFPQHGTFSNAGGGIDTIDLSSLNVHLSLPLRSLSAGDMPAVAKLVVDNSAIPISSPFHYQWNPGLQINPNTIAYLGNNSPSGWKCVNGPFTVSGVVDSNNTFHSTPPLTVACGNSGTTTPGTDGWSLEGTLSTTGVWTTLTGTDPAGNVYSLFPGTSVTDPHGNKIQGYFDVNFCLQARSCGPPNGVTYSGSLTDAANATVLTSSSSIASLTPTVTYPDVNGASQPITLTYGLYNEDAYFGCAGETDYWASGFANYLLTRVAFPDGSFYSFGYEPTFNHSTFTTGRIASVTLPTGGIIRYDYSTYGTHGQNCNLQQTAGFTKTTPDGVWKFDNSTGTNAAQHNVTVTAPDGTYTGYNFDYEFETLRLTKTAVGGTTLSTVTTCYNNNFTGCATYSGLTNGQAITQKNVYTDIGASAGAAQVQTNYDSYGRLTDVRNYDFGQGANNYATHTALVYGSYSGGVCNALTGILNRVCSTTVFDSSSHILSYGLGVFNASGDQTQHQQLVSGNTYLISSASYNANGTLHTTTDVNGTITNYTQGDCGGFFPTGIAAGGVSRFFAWDCNGEVIKAVNDGNGNPATVITHADPLWRPDSVTDPTGALTSFSYTPTSSTSSMLFGLNSQNTSVVTLDSMGRPFDTQVKNGSTYKTFTSAYDVNGRPSSTTQPCSVALGASCPTVETTQTYDGLNRPLVTTTAAGGTITNTYAGRDVLTTLGPASTGENVKSKQYEYDGLGRLLSVCEISSMTGSGPCGQDSGGTGFRTSYTYDPLGRLLTVTQGAQTRTYGPYDGLGRMSQEINPENGTTTYTYDTAGCSGTSNGDLVRQADAVGNVTCYHYDNLHRVTSVTYSGPYLANTPSKTFVYDAATVNGQTMQNVNGRLAEAYTGARATDEGFSYTARGELADYYQSSPTSGGFYHTVQSYWPNGTLASISGVGLPIINYGDMDGSGLDVMGNVKTVTASAGVNPVSAVTYSNYNYVTSATFGSSDVATFNYDVHGQMTKYQEAINGTIVSGVPAWNANGSLKKLTIVDPLNSGDAQTCNYTLEDLARLSKVDCGTKWGQTFTYDPFGNIAKQVISGDAGQNFQATYNTNNRIHDIGGLVPTYDANGNLLTDTFHTYTWNINGRPATVDTATLTYDAFDHVIEKTDGGVDNEYVYLGGQKLAVMDGQVQKNAYVPLPGGTQAVYVAGTLSFYQVPDWQGSYRIASTQGRALKFSQAFAPFGESYALSGTGSRQSFAGNNSDTETDMADAGMREEHTTQGRWISPDPAGLGAVSLADPQSWNRYAYVSNNPLISVDPSGLEDPNFEENLYFNSGEHLGQGNSSFSSLCFCTSGDSENTGTFLDFVNTSLMGANGSGSDSLLGNMEGVSTESQPLGGAGGSWDGPQMLNFSDLWSTSAGQSIESAFARNPAHPAVVGGPGLSSFEMSSMWLTVGSAPSFFNINNTEAVFHPSEAPAFQQEGTAFRQYLVSRPATRRTGGQALISVYQEALDGSGMWRTSNHWGTMTSTKWMLGSPEYMESIGGLRVEPEFWLFNEPVTGWVRFADMTPYVPVP